MIGMRFLHHKLCQCFLAFLLLGALSLRAQAQDAVNLLLDSPIKASSALFLVAQEKGYFAKEGLNVTIETGVSSLETIKNVGSSSYDLGFADINTLIRAREDISTIRAKAVLMIQDKPTYVLVGRKSRGMSGAVSSFNNRLVGGALKDPAYEHWPVFQAHWQAQTDETGPKESRPLSIRLEPVSAAIREPMLIQGELDAVIGSAPSILSTLKARNMPLDEMASLILSDYGLELYGHALIASHAIMEKRPELIAKFIRALVASLQDIAKDQAGAAMLAVSKGQNLRPEVEAERLNILLKDFMLTPFVRMKGWGDIDEMRFQKALDQIAKVQSFKTRPNTQDIFTRAYLPPLEERRVQ
jgi:NitT/TauT family transport system substrate-binding protein